MKMVEYQSINFAYQDHVVLDDTSFSFEEGKSYFILGTSASGKSTLAKVLTGELASNVEVDTSFIGGVPSLKKTTTLIDALFSSLDGMNLSIEEEKDHVRKIINNFNLSSKLSNSLQNLSYPETVWISLLCGLVPHKMFLVIDDLFSYLTQEQVESIFKYCQQEGINLIYLSSSLKYSTYFNYLYVLHEGRIAMEGNMMDSLKEEKVLTRLGFQLPFMVDLSIQLGYYGLLDHVIIDPKEMISSIWN